MKQIFQSLENGETLISDIPSPSLKKGHLLIKSSYSLISTGTEKMLIEFGKSNLIEKAKGQPDKINEVIQKLKIDGFIETYKAIQNKLSEPFPLGYCNVGEIIEVGDDITEFQVGDRVVSNGPHAEIVLVPKNLCAIIPDEVPYNHAVFTIPAAIGLQGIRLLKPTFGETFLIIGLGLIGNLTAQLLASQGCKVIGLDTDPDKCKLANELGIQTVPNELNNDPEKWCLSHNKNIGLDGVIITASTKSNDPITIAPRICRKRGRIVLIGVTGLNLNRDLLYEKEISLQVSCSYGPGRYDNNYEKKGIDYPIGFVRWTEKRNFEAILFALQEKKIKVEKLISKEFDINNAQKAYEQLSKNNKNNGILISYIKNISNNSDFIRIKKQVIPNQKLSPIKAAVFGVGNYSSRIMLPILFKSKIQLKTLVAESGLKPFYFGKKFNFEYASTSKNRVIKDPLINTIFIATRHDSHQELIIDALNNNKNIFVEKPLCINKMQLKNIKETYKKVVEKNYLENTKPPILMIGFNRRFSPYTKIIKNELKKYSGPKTFIYTCNAGFIPNNHWVHDREVGGGRLIGEACHFVDLIRFLCDHKIKEMNIFHFEEQIRIAL